MRRKKGEIYFRNNGAMVIISSSQNVVSLQAADGKINYNNYFKDIGNSRKKWGKALGAAAYVAGGVMEMNDICKGNFNITQQKTPMAIRLPTVTLLTPIIQLVVPSVVLVVSYMLLQKNVT